MQLYAFDLEGQVIFARDASRQMDYFCPECKGVVRLRGGLHRQNHFYHLEATRSCRQSGKSLEHLNVQLFFLNAYPQGECSLELRFPEINRIADVFWISENIVFEIQCSPISRQEVQARNRDYKSLDLEVIWILHDKRYNQKRLTSMEDYLHHQPHYFTNINEDGEGIIYDQFSQLDKGYRVNRMLPLAVDVQQHKRMLEKVNAERKVLNVIKRRLDVSLGYFSNDLVDQCINLNLENDYIEKAFEAELASGITPIPKTLCNKLKFMFYQYVVRPYCLLFQLLLEKACK
jgi:competence protein CoiA